MSTGTVLSAGGLPCRLLEEVFHVGTLNPEMIGQGGSRGGVSLEGHHLSVSLHPEHWRRLAKLGDAPTHRLTRSGATFLDAHATRQGPQLATLLTWGEGQGLITPGVQWEAAVTEDGQTCWLQMPGAGHAALEAWAHLCEQDAPEDEQLEAAMTQITPEADEAEVMKITALLSRPFVRRRRVPLATEALRLQTGVKTPGDATDALLIAWASKDHTTGGQPLDGVWWADALDPGQFSAPRGLILREQVRHWAAHPTAGTGCSPGRNTTDPPRP